MVPLLAVVPFGPLLAWKRGDLFAAAQRLMVAFAGALLAVLVDAAVRRRRLGVRGARRRPGRLADLRRADRPRASSPASGSVAPAVMLRRFAGLPRSVFGTALAHLGLGLTVLGIVGVHALGDRDDPHHEAGRDARTVRLHAALRRAPAGSRVRTTREDRGRFALLDAAAAPSARSSRPSASIRSRADADDRGRHHDHRLQPALRLARRRRPTTARVVVRIWWKPLVTLIWLGALVMMAGGACR